MARKKEVEKPKSPWEEWDGEYIGNIWGWNNSFKALLFILIIVAIMAYRFWSLGISPLDNPPPPEKTEVSPVESREI